MFECSKCGNCCKTLVITVSYSDIKRWQKERRVDIIREVVFVKNAPKGDGFYFETTIVLDKDHKKRPCIFLTEDNLCSIHETKPRICRDAPHFYSKESKFQDLCPVWVPEHNDPNEALKLAKEIDKKIK